MIEQRIEQDLKTALLAGNRVYVTTLRGIKTVLQYAKVAAGTRDELLSDEEVIVLLRKEAKKRQESADLYKKGGNEARAEAELAEKRLIESYMPAMLSEAEVAQAVDKVLASDDYQGPSAMGQVIGLVKQETRGLADGALIARLVRERLNQ